MSKPTTFTPPTPLELARLDFEDAFSDALDNLHGAATILDSQKDGELEALHLVSNTLYRTEDRLRAAHDRVKSLQDAESATTGGEQDEGSKTRDKDLGTRAIVDAAHIDCLTANSALSMLAGLVVEGELNPSIDVDMDAFVVYVDGISARIDGVADALDKLLDRLGAGDKKEG